MTDYKKLYEEALERAKEMSALPDDRATMEYIFPELKESEDEKIRKELMDFVVGNTISKDGRREKYLAWLEKQGEKLPVGFYYVDSNGNKYFSDTFKNGNFTFHVEKDEQIPANSAKTCKDEQENLEYNYEQYDITSDWCNGEVIEHIKDYINDAQEIKITRISNGWSLEIKTRIK